MLSLSARMLALSALVISTLLVAGCSDSSDPGGAPVVVTREIAPVAVTREPASLRSGNASDLRKIVVACRGKVVLVDFWATWCGPCRKQFSHTVKLHQQHEADGLVVVSISMDSQDDRAEVVDFLTSQGATFANLISHGDGQQDYEDFGISGLPHYVIFDRNGIRHDLASGDPEKPLSTELLDKSVAEFLSK